MFISKKIIILFTAIVIIAFVSLSLKVYQLEKVDNERVHEIDETIISWIGALDDSDGRFMNGPQNDKAVQNRVTLLLSETSYIKSLIPYSKFGEKNPFLYAAINNTEDLLQRCDFNVLSKDYKLISHYIKLIYDNPTDKNACSDFVKFLSEYKAEKLKSVN